MIQQSSSRGTDSYFFLQISVARERISSIMAASMVSASAINVISGAPKAQCTIVQTRNSSTIVSNTNNFCESILYGAKNLVPKFDIYVIVRTCCSAFQEVQVWAD